MRRVVIGLVVLSFAVLAAAAPGSVDNPNTPPDGASNAEPMCLLDKLEFTNGLTLIGGFKTNVFHYQCSCSNWGTGPYSTVVKPHMMDSGSSAEITFNGVKKHFRTMNNAISNGGDNGVAPHSPLTESSPLTFITGLNTIIVGVGCNGNSLPDNCYYQYTITCTKPGSGGEVVGDPQFTGLRGQNYQVHGVSGEIYNIVSDADLQYNSRFVFLTQGKCPVVDGKKQKGCWSHPGSYLGELGLKTRVGDRIHINTGAASEGFALVEVNQKMLNVGDSITLADNMGSVSLNTTHLATVTIGNWEFIFENSDMFLNQRVRVLDARSLRSHGLLGQTWRETTYPNAIKYIQGSVDDYVIRDAELFGDNFVFNNFN